MLHDKDRNADAGRYLWQNLPEGVWPAGRYADEYHFWPARLADLSARIEAARMADNRERRAWILEVERARAKSGSNAPSSKPPRPVPRVGAPVTATGREVH